LANGAVYGVFNFMAVFSEARKTAEFVKLTCGNGKNSGCIVPDFDFYEKELNCVNMALTNRGSASPVENPSYR
jgi:hypothetical protein